MAVTTISAVTFAVRQMARSITFYEKCGFKLVFGGASAAFSTLQSGEAFVNLIATPGHRPAWWGRVIFHVDDVDAHFAMMTAAGLSPQGAPANAPWGERYFQITDPDGHELSFAQLIHR